MAETLFARVRRVVSGGIEDVADAMERAGGLSVMREAIREVDRAIEDVRTEHDAATARRLQAMRQQRLFRDQVASLSEKAAFAIAARRDDLAEAAVSRQLEFEAQAARLEGVQAEAGAEAARLDACLAALTARGTQMRETLAAFEAAQREAPRLGEAPSSPDRQTGRRVERAEQAFDRAMQGAGGVAGLDRTDPVVAGAAAAGVAELAVLQRSAAIAQRIAALRQAQAVPAGE